jgi:formiminotetrahydrofolate cyclodeaminase
VDEPLTEVLGRFAARTPAPGGASAAAVACAMAAALVEMAAGFAGEVGGAGAAGDRAAQLRQRAVELADLDLASYRPVLEALRRGTDDPARPDALAAALSAATEVPLEVARVSAEVSALAAGLADTGSRHLIGDATTAAVLAHAACQAATVLVQINLKGATDERPTQAGQWCGDADVARQRALSKAHES